MKAIGVKHAYHWVAIAGAFASVSQAHAGVVLGRVSGTIIGNGMVLHESTGNRDDAVLNAPYDIELPTAPLDQTGIDSALLTIDGGLHEGLIWGRGTLTQEMDTSLSGETFAFALHNGVNRTDTQRKADVSSFQIVTLSVPVRSTYRFHGFVSGLVDANVPTHELRRYAVITLKNSAGVVLHRFEGLNLQTYQGGPFDVSGLLEAGTYRVEAESTSRATYRQNVPDTPAGDPMVSRVTWSFEATPTCSDLDFNNDGLFPDESDVIAFLTVLAGGTCASCDGIDFNNDGLSPDDADLVTFLRVLAGGEC